MHGNFPSQRSLRRLHSSHAWLQRVRPVMLISASPHAHPPAESEESSQVPSSAEQWNSQCQQSLVWRYNCGVHETDQMDAEISCGAMSIRLCSDARHWPPESVPMHFHHLQTAVRHGTHARLSYSRLISCCLTRDCELSPCLNPPDAANAGRLGDWPISHIYRRCM